MRREDIPGGGIFLIHDFLSPEDCRRLIALSEEWGYEAATITTGDGFLLLREVRNNMRVIVDARVLAERLFARARPFLPPQVDGWHVRGLNERFRYYRYDVGQTFKPHYDGSYRRHPGEESRLTFMVYLNDDCEGGETKFYHDDETPRVSIVPRRGAALVFVHEQLHEGAPVLRGRKYAVRTDVMYSLDPGTEVNA